MTPSILLQDIVPLVKKLTFWQKLAMQVSFLIPKNSSFANSLLNLLDLECLTNVSRLPKYLQPLIPELH